MAMIIPAAPICEIRGKLRKSDDIYYTVRNGRQYSIRIPEWVDHPTDTQLIHRERMRQCSAAVHQLLSCPETRSHYHAEWQAARAAGTDSHHRLCDYLYSQFYHRIYAETPAVRTSSGKEVRA